MRLLFSAGLLLQAEFHFRRRFGEVFTSSLCLLSLILDCGTSFFFPLLLYFEVSLFSLVWTERAVRDGLLAAAFAVCC